MQEGHWRCLRLRGCRSLRDRFDLGSTAEAAIGSLLGTGSACAAGGGQSTTVGAGAGFTGSLGLIGPGCFAASGAGGGGASGAASSRGRGSITGPGSSAIGTFHSKASSRPDGDTGIQRSDTKPSAVQAGSRAAVSARAIYHSRARPMSACSCSSSSAMRVATRWVGAASNGARLERARAKSCAAIAARAEANAPSGLLPGVALRQFAHAIEFLARRLALPQIEVDVGEIGVRMCAPRRLDDAACAAGLAGLTEKCAGQRRGGD